MDELDQRIISLLQVDGRVSNAEIARKLGVVERTIRRRVSRLVQDDVIKVTAVPNIEKMGYSTTAMVGIETRPSRADEVAEALVKWKKSIIGLSPPATYLSGSVWSQRSNLEISCVPRSLLMRESNGPRPSST